MAAHRLVPAGGAVEAREELVEAKDLRPGDVVRVRPGDAVLVDRAIWHDLGFERWLTDALGGAPLQSINARDAVFLLSDAVQAGRTP